MTQKNAWLRPPRGSSRVAQIGKQDKYLKPSIDCIGDRVSKLPYLQLGGLPVIDKALLSMCTDKLLHCSAFVDHIFIRGGQLDTVPKVPRASNSSSWYACCCLKQSHCSKPAFIGLRYLVHNQLSRRGVMLDEEFCWKNSVLSTNKPCAGCMLTTDYFRCGNFQRSAVKVVATGTEDPLGDGHAFVL